MNSEFKKVKIISIAWIYIVAIQSIFSNAVAAVYWVDPSSSIEELCSREFPCTSVFHATKLAKPGDDIILMNGIYNAIVIRNLNGTSLSPIHIKSNGEHAYIYSDPNRKLVDSLEIKKSQHIVLSGLKFSEAVRAAIRINNSNNITILDNEIIDSGRWGVFTNHSTNIKIIGNRIKGKSREHGIYISNSGDNVLIKNNRISKALGGGIHINGDLSMGGGMFAVGDVIISNVTISDNLIEDVGLNGGAGINLDGVNGAKISRNIIWNASASGIAAFKHNGAYGSKNIEINGNLIHLAKKSRFALAAKYTDGPIFFFDNIVFSHSKNKGIFEVMSRDYERDAGWITRLKRKVFTASTFDLPIISNRNIFSFSGAIASIDDVFYGDLSDWIALSGGADLNTRELESNQVLDVITTLYSQLAFSKIEDEHKQLITSKD